MNLSVSTWIRKIEQIGELHGWNNNYKIYVMQSRLKGLAKHWFENLNDYMKTWDEWKVFLVQSFPEHQDFAEILKRLVNRKKLPDESMARYYYDKKVHICLRWVYLTQDCANSIGNQEKDIACFNCKKKGHYANQCKEPAKRCSKCKRWGHQAHECSKVAGESSEMNKVMNVKSSNNNSSYFMKCRVSGVIFDAFIDTGSSVILMKQSSANKPEHQRVDTAEALTSSTHLGE
ncbi:uncharacterized protein [Musca autumnalis]|uniref:uncharacterized protein n=1 Tax=Musca autumnalis TaxID=221902 RepID=UPI003CF7454D